MKAVPGEKIAAIADVVDEGLALCREGRIWWASERMASLLGCSSAEQLMGQLICDRLVDTGAGFPNPGGGSVCCAVRGSKKDSMPLEVHCVPVRSGELWLAGPNEVLVIQDTNVWKHVRNRDLGNVRPRPVAKDGLNAFAFEELVHKTDLCGVPISKNFVHYEIKRRHLRSLANTLSNSS